MDMGQGRVIKTDDCKACLCQVGNIPAEKQEVLQTFDSQVGLETEGHWHHPGNQCLLY